jgi:RNA polymerase sigma factor (sigma-70 family)
VALAPDLPDEALVAAMAAGDEEAGVLFVRRYQSRAYGLALRIVGDAALAEDVAQETLVRVWRHAAVFDPRRGRVGSWVLTIARNLAIDAVRLRKAVPIDPELLVGLVPASAEPSPEDSATVDDSVSRLRVVLERLAPEQRRALLLAAFYGRTAAEISAQESIPLGTAKTRIRTALGKVRAALTASEA